MAERRTVEVWADWEGLTRATRMGHLHATPARGKEIFSFEYDGAWLKTPPGWTFDPALGLHHGPQYARAGTDNFGVFLDSSPDRWGRVLLQRREGQRAREEGRKPRRLAELDYLLGVFDGHRMGGLRFRVDGGAFLDDDEALASPPWTSLRELEHASRELEKDGAEDAPAYGRWLRMLIAPGRSLGGARPKASVVDANQRLWIAKLPSERDEDDVGAWEGVVHALAARAGITTAEARTQRFGGRHHTFLTRRFDRQGGGGRVHFVSAMTLLERADGEEGASYLDLAAALAQHGGSPARDLAQLWRRVVFNVCVSNVDDHLRNHGFLLGPTGWSLAPAYDMNPVATGGGLSLNVSETDNAQDLELVREVAGHFRVAAKEAHRVVAEVTAVVRGWRAEADAAGISRGEQDRMSEAFSVAERDPESSSG